MGGTISVFEVSGSSKVARYAAHLTAKTLVRCAKNWPDLSFLRHYVEYLQFVAGVG